VAESITYFAVGPLIGLAANGVIAILCLATLSLYPHYRPLRSLFLFYLFIALAFLGWVVYGLQKSPESILLGNRILYAAIASLPAIWFWFYLSLFNEKPERLTWVVTGISFILAALALLGRGPLLFGFPMEPDPIALNVMRPQSKLLKPLIQSFCLMACIFYFLMIILRLRRFKGRRPVYLLLVGIGLFIWFLGALHDSLRVAGMAVLYKDYILWFASLWLSIFLTIAVSLHFRSIEQAAREELERLNKVKGKALDHLSHELRTPLSVIKGSILVLRRMLLSHTSPVEGGRFFEAIDKQLTRLCNIQKEADKIIRYHQELERKTSSDESNRLTFPSLEPVSLNMFADRILVDIKQRAAHRNIHFHVEGPRDLFVLMDSEILEDVLEGLLKNAIENTPDEGMIRIQWERENQKLLLKVQDFGIGITEENQKYIFDGLFHTQETDLYTSKRPYDFSAGGKGLHLLQMKIYGQCFDFDLWVESRRCIYLPTDRDFCPGKISLCAHCQTLEACLASGGSIFYLSFPIAR
jgi:signal transduction histidine kinase